MGTGIPIQNSKITNKGSFIILLIDSVVILFVKNIKKIILQGVLSRMSNILLVDMQFNKRAILWYFTCYKELFNQPLNDIIFISDYVFLERKSILCNADTFTLTKICSQEYFDNLLSSLLLVGIFIFVVFNSS